MANTRITPRKRITAKGSFDSYANNDTFIIDLDTAEYLGLQGLPMVLNNESNSRFISVNAPMRNNPHYIFSGSEDILEFQITWFTDNPDRLDVISRCKWLETCTKADGYKGRPHFVKFKWGKLMQDSIWIVTSAKYTLSNFNKAYGFAPMNAVQTVGLRRVTLTNSTHDQIASYKW